ncbi:hypothetical protein [Massilia glaciei]|uniref:Uncharacterized protein n=1 Tax=Massilia glaciei TaxID=1524097 RepID=A0A2U2I6Y6_9BURK|nr:hypothetical protein [Massilia glaciei]PWF55507.1 hypothetical protein C7C56_001425 [Massilia glaciei]
MAAGTLTPTDLLVRWSRRHLWFCVAFIGVVGALALAMLAFPGGALAARAGLLFGLLPVVIAISVGALRSAPGGAGGAAMRAVLDDELRQASLNRAYRNGVACVLLMQPALALALALGMAELANPVAVMACATSAGAALVVLLSALYYDR